jgi:hypothetical protein
MLLLGTVVVTEAAMADPYSAEEAGGTTAGNMIDASNLNRLAMQKTVAETQHYQAQTQQEMQKVAMEKQQAQMQQAQQRALQKVALANIGKSLLEQTTAQAEAAMLVGSMESLKSATQARDNVAKADNSEAQAQEKQFQLQKGVGEYFGQLADAIPVGNQKAYEAAFDYSEKMAKQYGIKLPADWKNKPWTEETKKELKEQSMTLVQKAEEARKNADEKRKQKETDAKVDLDNATTALRKAQTTAVKDRDERTGKAGGKNAAPITKNDVETVFDKIKHDDPSASLEDTDVDGVARLIAADASDRARRNPALSKDVALQQAYAEAKRNGMISSATIHKPGITVMGKEITSGSDRQGSKYNPNAERPAETIKESKVTTTKPAGATDAEWAAYKKEMGIK